MKSYKYKLDKEKETFIQRMLDIDNSHDRGGLSEKELRKTFKNYVDIYKKNIKHFSDERLKEIASQPDSSCLNANVLERF